MNDPKLVRFFAVMMGEALTEDRLSLRLVDSRIVNVQLGYVYDELAIYVFQQIFDGGVQYTRPRNCSDFLGDQPTLAFSDLL